jgi:hypothetical protein
MFMGVFRVPPVREDDLGSGRPGTHGDAMEQRHHTNGPIVQPVSASAPQGNDLVLLRRPVAEPEEQLTASRRGEACWRDTEAQAADLIPAVDRDGTVLFSDCTTAVGCPDTARADARAAPYFRRGDRSG